MKIPENNAPCSHMKNNNCQLGEFGGRPSQAVCIRACKKFELDRSRLWTLVQPTISDPPRERRKLTLRHRWVNAKTIMGKSHCTTCGDKAKLHVWLGIKWIGYPYPRRILDQSFDHPGCGCVLKLKRLQQAVKMLLVGRR